MVILSIPFLVIIDLKGVVKNYIHISGTFLTLIKMPGAGQQKFSTMLIMVAVTINRRHGDW